MKTITPPAPIHTKKVPNRFMMDIDQSFKERPGNNMPGLDRKM
jgi:hypothetical protein